MANGVSTDIINELIAYYQNGKSVKELVDMFNLHSDTIIKYLKQNNVFKPKTHNWSKEMDKKLAQIYPLGDWDLIFQTFPGRSRSFIYSRASELGLHDQNYYWSIHDKNILVKYYYVIPVREIQKMLERQYTIRQIQNQAGKMNLTQDRHWTDDEMNIMKEKYATLGPKGMMKFLPRKSVHAITAKAKAMGLRCDCFWSDSEKQYLIDNWTNMTDEDIAKELGRGVKGVADQRRKLGLYYDVGHNGYETLINYLRMNITDWKRRSMEACKYKCVLTGESFDDIHHIYSFNLILSETLERVCIEDRESIDDYTDQELLRILEVFHTIQNEYPLGVCLSKNVHKLFHKIYGYGNNTIDQWNEFEKNYKNGVFNINN